MRASKVLRSVFEEAISAVPHVATKPKLQLMIRLVPLYIVEASRNAAAEGAGGFGSVDDGAAGGGSSSYGECKGRGKGDNGAGYMDDRAFVTAGEGHVIDAFTVAYHPDALPFLVPRHQVLKSVREQWATGEEAGIGGKRVRIISIEEDEEIRRSRWPYLPKWQGVTVDVSGGTTPCRVSLWDLQRLGTIASSSNRASSNAGSTAAASAATSAASSAATSSWSAIRSCHSNGSGSSAAAASGTIKSATTTKRGAAVAGLAEISGRLSKRQSGALSVEQLQPLPAHLQPYCTPPLLDPNELKRIALAINACLSTSSAQPFRDPPEATGDYTAVVPAPCWLKLVRQRLENGWYHSHHGILADIRRVYLNAHEYASAKRGPKVVRQVREPVLAT